MPLLARLGGVPAVVALLLLAAAPASAAKRPNQAAAAAKVASGLAKAKSESVAKKQLITFFRGVNVTVLGAKGKRRQVLVRGFARSPRDPAGPTRS